jgi:hypothetical protein
MVETSRRELEKASPKWKILVVWLGKGTEENRAEIEIPRFLVWIGKETQEGLAEMENLGCLVVGGFVVCRVEI